MKNLKKLLLITHNQFGYQISSYYYAHYLKDKFRVDYLSFNEGKEEIEEEGIQIVYKQKQGNLFKAYFGLIRNCIRFILKEKPDYIVIKYFPACSLIPIMTWRKMILDVRTASVSTSGLKNLVKDFLLRFESLFFSKVIILSQSLKQRLIMPAATVVPLGATPKGFSHKQFNSLQLLYIGSFNNRNIDITIEGLKHFKEKHPQTEVQYTIVGSGNEFYTGKMLETIKSTGLEKSVSLTGRIPHTKLTEYYLNANVGIAFIPQTKYFDKQPPSKTYEYLMAGMPVLATSTYENKRVVNEKNGVLITDTPESFAAGLESIWEKRHSWNSDTIAESVEAYNWKTIIHEKLLPLLQ